MVEKVEFKTYREMPIRPMTVTDMLWNRTGSWRNVRPYYDYKTSPCKAGCPTGENIQRYIYLVTENDYENAWKTIIDSNPMPAVTGRVCFHPCMANCTRRDFDESVNINAIERSLGDKGLENPQWMSRSKATKNEKVAVVGSGPAGLSCAFYLARQGYPVTLFEMEKALGGILRWGIPEFRLPNDTLDKVISAIVESGPIKVRTGIEVGRDPGIEEIESEYDAVFLGLGLTRSREIGIDNEDCKGVEPGLEFLKRVNSGEKVDPGKKVAVIGGGNTAMDVARSAIRCGSDVTVFYRRTMAEMPAIREEIEEAEKEGVKFHFLCAPKELVVKGKRLSSVVFQKMELGEPDDSGRRRPVPVEGETFSVEVDSLFPAIGEQADLDPFSGHLETEWDLVSAKGDFGETSNEKIFAGGDIVTGAASVVEAIAAGRKAAERIGRFLSGEEEPIMTPPNVVGIDDMNTAYFSHVKQNRVPTIAAEQIKGTFREIKTGFTEELLHNEADRCFSCGVCNYCDNCWIFCPDVAIKRGKDEYEIDYDYCKGCLVCVEECPRSAFSTREEGK
ncbi:MAG: FAD-dependent oxidoreductase [Candidatus Krumholzibacteriota bacterium]|nr:FAD-dependent oxidoreductase [Candidatus Krumholzibacteriota bacterium]